MRKALLVFLAVLTVVFCGYFTAWGWVQGTETRVSWQETTIFGDRAVVDDLKVTASNTQSNRLLWETTGTLGDKLNPKTNFTFSNQYIHRDRPFTYSGLEMHTANDIYGMHDRKENRTPFEEKYFPDLVTFVQEAYDSVNPGDPETFFTVDMREYTPYYVFDGSIYLPNCPWGMWNLFDASWYYDVPETVSTYLNDYFRIPIIGQYIIEFSVNKEFTGSTSMGGQVSLDYEPYFFGCANEDANYFSFPTRNESGDIADTSLIPGGYGIYRLNYDYDENGIFHMGDPLVEMVYPLDPWVTYAGLEFSDDGKHLYLLTIEENSYYRTIIDIETMTQLQKLYLRERNPDGYARHHQYEDFLVIIQARDYDGTNATLSLFSEDPDGLYTQEFTVSMDTEAFAPSRTMDLLGYDDFHMDYNGSTLAVGQNIPVTEPEYHRIFEDKCDFYILTYDASGMTYAGLYEVNLSEINAEDDRCEGPCKIFHDIPIVLSWQ